MNGGTRNPSIASLGEEMDKCWEMNETMKGLFAELDEAAHRAVLDGPDQYTIAFEKAKTAMREIARTLPTFLQVRAIVADRLAGKCKNVEIEL